MPYGNSADGSLKLNPRAGFDDLAGSSAISPDHESIGPFAPSMLEHVPAEDPMGEVSIDAALPGRSGNATGVEHGESDDTEDLDRLLGEMRWGESDSSCTPCHSGATATSQAICPAISTITCNFR